MVWRNKHRAGRRKRERIAALRKGPVITSIESGQFISDEIRQQLRLSAWRAKYANRPVDDNIELIDLTLEEPPIPENTDKSEFLEDTQNLEPSPSIYTTTITKYFSRIEQHLMAIKYPINN